MIGHEFLINRAAHGHWQRVAPVLQVAGRGNATSRSPGGSADSILGAPGGSTRSNQIASTVAKMSVAEPCNNWFGWHVPDKVVIIGVGQLGRAFADAFLRSGVTVVPVLRRQSIRSVTAQAPDAELVLVAVGEDDLSDALADIPDAHLDRVVLLQNELRPDQWQRRYPEQLAPSTLIIWFEKKGFQAPKGLRPSVFHPQGALTGGQQLVLSAFHKLDQDVQTITCVSEFHQQLVIKNLFILALNLVGLKTGGSAGQLLTEHRRTLDVMLDELLLLEDRLFERAGFPGMASHHDLLRAGLEAAIQSDPEHGSRGRSAPQRLERTLKLAASVGLNLPHLASLRNYVS